MKRLLLALVLLAMPSAALAQSNVRIVGRAPDGIDRPVLVTTDGKIQVDSAAGGVAGTPSPNVTSVQGVPNGTPVAISRQDGTAVTFTGATVINSILFSTDTSGYGGVAVQIVGTVGVITWEASDDNTTWVAVNAQNSNTLAFATTTSAAGLYLIPAQHRYVRGRISTASGAITGAALLRYSSLDPATNTVSLGAGSVNVGGIYQYGGAGATSGSPLLTTYALSSAATTNSTLVAAGTHRLFGGQMCNTTASFKYVKFYNKATAPTVGTDTPVLTVSLPANGCVQVADLVNAIGQYYTLGLGIGITGAWLLADTTAVAAGDVVLSLLYY